MSSLNIRRPAQHDLVYGRAPAGEFLEFLGPLSASVLDIGPGEGGWADLLRGAGARHLVAVEPHRASADVARSRYDLVLQQPIETLPAEVIGSADLIIAADTLEHLFDPWKVLRRLHGAAAAHAELAISVPNLRYLGIIGPALLRGTFEYSDAGGIMDRGHLRWFTHTSLARALEASGWSAIRWSGSFGTGRRARLQRLSGERATSLLAHQIYVLAAKRPSR